MSGFDYPVDTPMVGADAKIVPSWANWVQRIHIIARSLQDSGPTTQRPVSVLWIGRRFFDTTLGIPVWVKEVNPAVVWVNAAGISV